MSKVKKNASEGIAGMCMKPVRWTSRKPANARSLKQRRWKKSEKRSLKSAITKVHDFGVKIVLVTLGSKGAVLSIDSSRYFIPIFKPRAVIDPTGAGDSFLGGFLAEFLNKKEAKWCAAIGAAIASLVVEKKGPNLSGKKEEIYQRAYAIYERETNSI